MQKLVSITLYVLLLNSSTLFKIMKNKNNTKSTVLKDNTLEGKKCYMT
jgi:hypothetical protein